METTDPTYLLDRLQAEISFQEKTSGQPPRSREYRRRVRRTILRFAKDLVYPSIVLKRRHNRVYSKSTLLDALVCAASNHLCTRGGCQIFAEETDFHEPSIRTPASNTILYHIRNLDSEGEGAIKVKEMFGIALRNTVSMGRRRGVFKRRMDIAIDLHDQPYYGDKNDFMVVESNHDRGTTHFFRFMTCSVVEAGRRFKLGSIAAHKLSAKEKMLGKMLDLASKEVEIRAVYVDRGFYSARVIRQLQRRNLRFLMPAPMNKKVRRIAAEFGAPCIVKYTMGRGSEAVEFNLAIVRDEKGRKRAFATNLQVRDGATLFDLYAKRWGIETSYRMIRNSFAPRTTSKNYIVRLFYFMLSVCLYNLWVLANILFGQIVLRQTPNKPPIPAAVFTHAFLRLMDS